MGKPDFEDNTQAPGVCPRLDAVTKKRKTEALAQAECQVSARPRGETQCLWALVVTEAPSCLLGV